MWSGDGLIVRLRISGGILDTELAGQIAQWSRQWGNGQIDLTSRGNLQLRGVNDRFLPALHDALADADLLDASAAGEAVRNVISSPLAGLDPTAILDVRPIARALEQRLSNDRALHALPTKFGFVIDDGGSLGLEGVPADVRFVAVRGDSGPEFAMGLAGSPSEAGRCEPGALVDVAAALSLLFLDARRGWEASIRRMRDLVAARGADAIVREASRGRWLPHGVISFTAIVSSPVAIPSPSAIPSPVVILGLDPRISSTPGSPTDANGSESNPPTGLFLGVGLPFGRIEAADLSRLPSAATSAGASELRLTPWRMVLIPVPTPAAAHEVAAAVGATRFILDPADPRRRVAACAGAPSCERATTPVLADAASLAAMLTLAPGKGTILHVSGCEKGCAHPRKAPVALVGRDGRYDLVRDGTPSALPHARGQTRDQAAAQLTAILAHSDAAA